MPSLNLRGKLIAAVPVPFDRSGGLLREAQQIYARSLAARGVDGVAVWAHTGRGLRLTPEQRGQVLADWRDALGPGRIVVAAAGAASADANWEEALAHAGAMALQARNGGADAIMVHPPTFLRQETHFEEKVLAFHDGIADAGLPIILFYLYERAGGISYPLELLSRLLEREYVAGIKVATLDSVMTFQDIARLVLDQFPNKTLITGEDRFFGYSLMFGASAALIGMGSACTEPQIRLLRMLQEGNAAGFLQLNQAVDALALATFREPMEGYIRRMLWCLCHEGHLPKEATFDPWGPNLDEEEFEELRAVVRRLQGALKS